VLLSSHLLAELLL